MDSLFHDAEPTLREQITEVEREIGFRERLYPHWIASGKLNNLKAARQLETMHAVLRTLKSLEGDGK